MTAKETIALPELCPRGSNPLVCSQSLEDPLGRLLNDRRGSDQAFHQWMQNVDAAYFCFSSVYELHLVAIVVFWKIQ